MPPVEVPHFSYPFRFETAKVGGTDTDPVFATTVPVDEQNTQAEIMSSVNVVARCSLGFRDERPDFGWPFNTFQTAPLDTRPLAAALERLEPRAQYELFEYADVLSQAVRHIQVAVAGGTS